MALPALLQFEGHEFRIEWINGEPWWVLAEVCRFLEIANAPQVASRLDEDEKGICNIDTLGGPQDVTIISEPGLYKVLRTSNKPQAKRFDRWNTHEVLPEIRKTGSYRGAAPTLTEIGQLFKTELEPVHRGMVQMREDIADVRGNVIFLTKRVDDMAPRREFTANTRRSWAVVIQRFYPGGKCPCCRKIEIVLDNIEVKGVANADHFHGKERISPQDGWLVCIKCNQDLKEASFKEKAKPHFRVFQDNLSELFGASGKQSERKRRKSKMTKNAAQFSWEF